MPRRKEPVTTEEPFVYFKPKNAAQATAQDVYEQNDITFLLGPAGTGKTHLAVAFALNDLHTPLIPKTNRKCNKVVITRPIIEAGEQLGYLPGEVEEKVGPYMLPIYDCINKMTNRSDRVIDVFIEIAPLAYMRGRTFEGCVAILDEAQNCTKKQLILFLSRLGVGGKLIITGDPDQSDINGQSGLMEVVDKLHGLDGVGIVHFTEQHIVRHPLVGEVLKRLSK